ncbi:hypothetical protein [Deinococcus sp.]|uniref:hypothetical protein n=1 Tax=Deinococcus sp. TaxID=47478 RepID=UPI003B5A256D
MSATQSSTDQSVDWASDAGQSVLRQLHRQSLLRRDRITFLVLIVLFIVSLVHLLVSGESLLLWLAGACTGAVLLRIYLELGRAVRAAKLIGLSHYRLDAGEDVLHMKNVLGEFRLPLTQIDRLTSLPAGVVLDYAGQSRMNLPSGTVASELCRRLQSTAVQLHKETT